MTNSVSAYPSRRRSDGDGDDGVDEALAEFLEVIEEAMVGIARVFILVVRVTEEAASSGIGATSWRWASEADGESRRYGTCSFRRRLAGDGFAAASSFSGGGGLKRVARIERRLKRGKFAARWCCCRAN